MSRVQSTTEELFLQLGSTPRSRSARADRLFRKLRDAEQREINETIIENVARTTPSATNNKQTKDV